MDILADHAVCAIRKLDQETFDNVLKILIDLHVKLLKEGEREGGNYANFNDDSFLFPKKLHEKLSNVYGDIFKASTDALENDHYFFKECCYVSKNLIANLSKNTYSSATGFDSIISSQKLLWKYLNERWEKACDKQGKKHDLSNPTEADPSFSKIHKDALNSLIGGWDGILEKLSQKTKPSQNDSESKPKNDANKEWKDLKKLFNAFNSHLKCTLFFLKHSVLSGNQESTDKAIDSLLRWKSDVSDGGRICILDEFITIAFLGDFRKDEDPIENEPESVDKDHKNDNFFSNLPENKDPEIVDINCNWQEVINFFEKKGEVVKNHLIYLDPIIVFSRILQKHSQDSSIILMSFFIKWAFESGKIEKNNLALYAVKTLIAGEFIGNAGIRYKKIFHFKDYISSFIRRNALERYKDFLDKEIRNYLT